ncbi:hypothetical protein BDY21DRAFT_152000 [Lineolata rhizophorae]|uniref:Uncharacterized protein n=1 Tax=Lineolata rhizophorae TaxID=578093 RepID=A0A6A6NM40_9PEZI|nr:hypothetical protein BDY21DRAFT_152000 [Lineolata rhizophorae]
MRSPQVPSRTCPTNPSSLYPTLHPAAQRRAAFGNGWGVQEKKTYRKPVGGGGRGAGLIDTACGTVNLLRQRLRNDPGHARARVRNQQRKAGATREKEKKNHSARMHTCSRADSKKGTKKHARSMNPLGRSSSRTGTLRDDPFPPSPKRRNKPLFLFFLLPLSGPRLKRASTNRTHGKTSSSEPVSGLARRQRHAPAGITMSKGEEFHPPPRPDGGARRRPTTKLADAGKADFRHGPAG